MTFTFADRYINLLTDFGFKRIFGTEPNKALLIDFLNTLLPDHHHIQDLTYRNIENLGNTQLDRKAFFDIYCQAKSGERFIVELQKAKQDFFKDRSVYYASFPIQEQGLKGDWNYELTAVYMVGVLDFIFEDHKNEKTLLHTVQLKNQDCKVFYDKLTFIYIELPKFKKNLAELESHFDKWLFLFRHLRTLEDPPSPLQEDIFNELFAAAELANFSHEELESYHQSLKYYWDMNSVMETARREARAEGKEEGWVEGQRSLLLRLLSRSLGAIPDQQQQQINQLSVVQLEQLSEVMLEFADLEGLRTWLEKALEPSTDP